MVLIDVVVPTALLLQSKVQPVHGLETVSVAGLLEQIANGPAGVTTGVTGNGSMVTATLLLFADVPHILVAVAV